MVFLKMLLSIIIPSKNRRSTLNSVVNYILNNVVGDYEIVIQDNSDNGEVLSSDIVEHDKVRFFHSSKSIPISDNTELAIENSVGRYIQFIGDDDFISPRIMDFVAKMDSQGIDNITYSAAYYWWDTVDFYKTNHYQDKNKLWIPKNISEEFVTKCSSDEVRLYFKRGGVSIGGLPRVYHGITSRRALDKIKDITGQYVVASCPDISLALSLSLVIDNFTFVNYPLSIYGASKGSGGGMTASRSHYSEIGDMPWLRGNITKVWDDNIPTLWSERTIYPQTATEVFSSFSKKHDLDFDEMYAALFAYEPFLYKYWVKAYMNMENKKYHMLIIKLIKKCLGQLLYAYKIKYKKLEFSVFTTDVNNMKKYF